ncbi:hypothetical protein K490DRAFT_70030 [Saccharata proteae CBS 121410]|uniref:CBF1-interacting co-repressor CIR N-terminal domain-containing protein n=1 Tax=Saccharata proteae CBS 121410 TaxID=1314787 RepID=A0A9P4HMC1_9PEZI|nr:hypothetical protein K490DRAFT_70030 [Saccharata proteae CBS 121410]
MEKGKRRGNSEYEKEKERKERELEDQYTMRFGNAGGGRGGDGKGLGRGWWERSSEREAGGEGGLDVEGVNVFGRVDPGVGERKMKRIEQADPLAVMGVGLAQKKRADEARRAWKVEKRREIEALIGEERERVRDRDREKERDSKSSSRRHHHSSSSHHHRRHHRNSSPRREDDRTGNKGHRATSHHRSHSRHVRSDLDRLDRD